MKLSKRFRGRYTGAFMTREEGKYKFSSGTAPCIVCEAGKFKEVTGSGECSECPEGSHSLQASDSHLDCLCNDCLCNTAFAGLHGVTTGLDNIITTNSKCSIY